MKFSVCIFLIKKPFAISIKHQRSHSYSYRHLAETAVTCTLLHHLIMSFSNIPSVVGVPDFGIIHIDPVTVAAAFQTYLNAASKITGVSLDDIELGVHAPPSDLASCTLVDLLKGGMRLFDAVVWLTAGRPASHPVTADAAKTRSDIPTLQQVARAVFYCYFMLITQARYPASRNQEDKPVIPKFLKTIMGMTADQHTYVETVCSFTPQQFDPKWAQHVRFDGMGQEVLSRFGLGVAGYRMFGPFVLYETRPDISQNLRNAVEFARTVGLSPATWSIHPLTRDPNILKSRGNLNKNLGNLILDVFTDEIIDEMVAAKVIFRKPEREPTHRNYLSWARDDNISGAARIF